MAVSVIKSAIWSFLQRGGSLIISFVSNMVLARLLCPEDFGTMAMIMVFVGVADVLVDGGLGNALIQKKEISKDDINTVFVVNVLFSVFLYFLIFAFAPFIASFTSSPNLILYLRIQAICVIIRACFTVHFSLLNRSMAFKDLAIIGLISNTLSIILAIILAYCGFGIWSLILKMMLLDVMSGLMYFYCCKEPVRWGFRIESFKYLFSFGFFVVGANVIENIYSNLLSFFIGKKYSLKDLGYYNQAYSLHQIPVYSVSAVVNQVFFPYFSKIQNGIDDVRRQFQNVMLVVTFFIYVLLSYLMVFAEPVITLLYSDKWLPSVPLFQVLCFSGFFNAILHLCRSTIKSMGRSKILLCSQLITTLIGLCFIFLFLNFSIRIFVFVTVINTLVAYFIAGYFAGKYIHFCLLKQIATILPNMSIAVFASVISFFCIQFLNVQNSIVLLIISFILNVICYLVLHYVFKTTSMSIILGFVNSKMKKR